MSNLLTPEQIAVGGKGTVKVLGPAVITGAIAALKIHTAAPGLVLHRELKTGETTASFGVGTNVTDKLFVNGAEPAADDFVLPQGMSLGRVEIGADEEITCILAEVNPTIE